mmetsp:Transcript_16619/g.43613  ORF Transcript_16619/g.43613 Transcript_16619/m.43613 type:complete len:303 (+) Transcript_16619:101-1009(+)
MTTFALCSCTEPMRESPACVADCADRAPWMTLAAGLSCTESMTVLHAMHRTGARPIISASSWGLNLSMASLRALAINLKTSSRAVFLTTSRRTPSRFSFSAPVTSSTALTTSSFEVSIMSMTVSVDGRPFRMSIACSKLSVAFSNPWCCNSTAFCNSASIFFCFAANSSRPGPPICPRISSTASSRTSIFWPCSSSDLLVDSDSTARSRSNDDLTSSLALSCLSCASFIDLSTSFLSAFVSLRTSSCASTKSSRGFNEVSPPAQAAVTMPANSSLPNLSFTASEFASTLFSSSWKGLTASSQ